MTANVVRTRGPAVSQANYALAGFNAIAVFAPYCKRGRFRKNDCRRCVEACPEHAISLDPGPCITQRCSECGLCVTACPTEVFRNESSREQQLLRRAGAQAAESETGQGRFSVHCREVGKPDHSSFSVLCLGNITGYCLSALATLGYEELVFVRGKCSDCHLKCGETLLTESISLAKAFLQGMAQPAPLIRVERAASPGSPADARRRFLFPLAGAFGRMQKAVSAAPCQGASRDVTGRKLLYSLIAECGRSDLPVVKCGPQMPWGKIAIDEDRCSACGVCAAVCLTAALVQKEESKHDVLCFNPALCINCRLCAEACAEKCVHFEEEFSLVDLMENKAQVVATVERRPCQLCGDPVRSGKAKFCPTCEKRGLSSTYVTFRE